MKKLFSLMILLATGNVFAAQESKQNDALVTEQTEIAQTKTDKQTPSFWVRHADKLKKVSYANYIFCLASYVMVCAIFNEKEEMCDWNKALMEIFSCCIIAKLFFDPITKVAITKKHTFELEALQAKLDAAQQKKVATA